MAPAQNVGWLGVCGEAVIVSPARSFILLDGFMDRFCEMGRADDGVEGRTGRPPTVFFTPVDVVGKKCCRDKGD